MKPYRTPKTHPGFLQGAAPDQANHVVNSTNSKGHALGEISAASFAHLTPEEQFGMAAFLTRIASDITTQALAASQLATQPQKLFEQQLLSEDRNSRS